MVGYNELRNECFDISESVAHMLMLFDPKNRWKCFYDLRLDTEAKFSCCNPNCMAQGCVFCTSPITAVICQTQHNIRIVPINACKFTLILHFVSMPIDAKSILLFWLSVVFFNSVELAQRTYAQVVAIMFHLAQPWTTLSRTSKMGSRWLLVMFLAIILAYKIAY